MKKAKRMAKVKRRSEDEAEDGEEEEGSEDEAEGGEAS